MASYTCETTTGSACKSTGPIVVPIISYKCRVLLLLASWTKLSKKKIIIILGINCTIMWNSDVMFEIKRTCKIK